jgi:hypothetical protein
MNNEITKKEDKAQINISGYAGSKSLTPNNIEEAYRIAQAFSKSNFIPQCYRGKPDDAFAAINLGMEVGLPPMRSLQSIAVVNGTPCIYGDAQLALVRASGKLTHFIEKYEGEEGTDNFCAVCELQRKGDEEITIERFSVSDAKKAKLWGKGGTWTTHPKRMMRYKARAFALRDKFTDVLLGLTHSVEEMEGEDMLDVTPKSKTAAAHQVPLKIIEEGFGVATDEAKKSDSPPNKTHLEEEIITQQDLYEKIREELVACDSEECLNQVRENYKDRFIVLEKEQQKDLASVRDQKLKLFNEPTLFEND